MPVTLKQGLMKYKNGDGEFVGINSISETATEDQLAAINSAGTTKVGAVNSAGTTQVSAVNGAGAEQVAAVEAKGAATLASIPSDYTNLSNQVSDLKSALEYADVIKSVDFSTAISGEFVSKNSVIVSGQANFSHTQPFAVKKGESVTFIARGYLDGVAMIASYNNGVYNCLVQSIDSTVRTYTYTATEDMNIVLSYQHLEKHIAYEYYNVKDIYDRITEVNNELTPTAELISDSNYRIVLKRQI